MIRKFLIIICITLMCGCSSELLKGANPTNSPCSEKNVITEENIYSHSILDNCQELQIQNKDCDPNLKNNVWLFDGAFNAWVFYPNGTLLQMTNTTAGFFASIYSYETNDNILTINANDNCDGTGRIVTSSQKYEIITRDDQSLILRIRSSDSLSYRDASPAPQPDIKND